MKNFSRRIAQSYNQIAEAYLKKLRSNSDANRNTLKYLKLLTSLLPQNSRVLDLGCGAGIPATKILAQNYQVTGVDFSDKQIKLARRNVPRADFIRANILEVDFPENSYETVTALYVIPHIPRKYHQKLLRKISTWLKNGGYFLATMGVSDFKEAKEDNWLGAPMFWSSFNHKKNLLLLKNVGFKILKAKIEIEKEINEKTRHLWVLGKKI